MAIAILAANQTPSKGDVTKFLSVYTINLFGSRKLTRQGRNWTLSGTSEVPQQLTEREAMFVNAALNAARGQA